MSDLALKLYNELLEEIQIDPNSIQTQKFKEACDKAVIENSHLNFGDQKMAARLYLNLILEFPDMSF